MIKTFEHSNPEDDLKRELILLQASQLAMCGQLDEAEKLIKEEKEILLSSPQALDMLARIAVRRGHFEPAKELWRTALAIDPGNEAAVKALASINKPWLVYAILRRLAFLAGLALVTILVLAGIMTVWPIVRTLILPADSSWNRISAPHRIASNRLIPKISKGGAEIVVPSQQYSSPKMELPAKQKVSFKPLPVFSLTGAAVSADGNGIKIVFNEGLFAYRDVLKDSAVKSLSELGMIVKDNAQEFSIIVEGYTDSDLMPPNTLFRNNYELGLHRAVAAIKIILTSTEMPTDSIVACSSGDKSTPFPNDSYENKQKNRTVVVHLIRK